MDKQIVRLIVPSKQSKDQRCYIRYYKTDPDTVTKKVAKDYSINNVAPKERVKYFNERKETMLNLSNLGYSHVDYSQYLVAKVQTLCQGIDLALKLKTSENIADIRNVTYHARIFNEWCKKNKLTGASPEAWNRLMLVSFSNFLKNNRKGSARTINNYINDLKMLANTAIDCGWIEVNPFQKFWKKLKNSESKRLAFLPDQQRKILDYADQRLPGYGLASRFMYYTLLRPKELLNLKFSDLDTPVKGKIFVRSDLVKTRNSKSIVLPLQLQQIIKDYFLYDYPKDWYIFSNNRLLPGPLPASPKTIGNKYSEYILRPLGFSSIYKFYSWKDTGFCMLSMAGISAGAIRQQAGHKNQQSFDAYTRSMGLWENPQVANQYPSTF